MMSVCNNVGTAQQKHCCCCCVKATGGGGLLPTCCPPPSCCRYTPTLTTLLSLYNNNSAGAVLRQQGEGPPPCRSPVLLLVSGSSCSAATVQQQQCCRCRTAVSLGRRLCFFWCVMYANTFEQESLVLLSWGHACMERQASSVCASLLGPCVPAPSSRSRSCFSPEVMPVWSVMQASFVLLSWGHVCQHCQAGVVCASLLRLRVHGKSGGRRSCFSPGAMCASTVKQESFVLLS